MRDPGNRCYRYPFTNCTNCGPRFSIVESLPYDRPNTTMARFAMCEACRREYAELLRRHPVSAGAAVAGRVRAEGSPAVLARSLLGVMRVLDMLSGEQLPRIC